MSTYLNMIQSVTSRYNDEIKKASQSFCEYFDLVQFWYNKVNNRGFVATLSNHPEWTEYFAVEKLYQKCPLLRHSQYLQEGIIILNDCNEESDMMQILNKGKSKYDMKIWVALVIKTKTGTEQFGFCANKASISLFFNELPIIKLFAKKFKENNKFVLSKLEDNQVDLINLIGPLFYKKTDSMNPEQKLKKDLLEKLGILNDIRLSPQEINVLQLVLQGHSASTIAASLFLSKRTIEHALERIKEKINCDSKIKHIQKARELEEIGYFGSLHLNLS